MILRRGWGSGYLHCSLLNAEKRAGKEGNQAYLKEGNIGKAESEEVVPVKTEQRSHVTLSLQVGPWKATSLGLVRRQGHVLWGVSG